MKIRIRLLENYNEVYTPYTPSHIYLTISRNAGITNLNTVLVDYVWQDLVFISLSSTNFRSDYYTALLIQKHVT